MHTALGGESVKLGKLRIVVNCLVVFILVALLAVLVAALFFECCSCFANSLLSGELGTDEGWVDPCLLVGGMFGCDLELKFNLTCFGSAGFTGESAPLTGLALETNLTWFGPAGFT